MNSKPTTLRERFFSKLAIFRKRDSEMKTKHQHMKRVMKRVAAKRTA